MLIISKAEKEIDNPRNNFFIIDYFFKLTGNFGWAIVIITALVRLIFFPLANYSFKSMAKMKILQPELVGNQFYGTL